MNQWDVVIDVRLARTRIQLEQAILPARSCSADLSHAFLRGEVASRAVVFLVGLEGERGLGVGSTLRRVREALPHAAVFVVSEQPHRHAGDLRTIALSGADDVFFLHQTGELAVLSDTIRRRLAVPPPERVLRMVSQAVDPPVRALAMWILANAYRRPSIEKAASVFRVSRKTIFRMLRDSHLPKYGELRMLGQALHALELNERHGLSARQAARRMRLADGSTMSRFQRRMAELAHTAPTYAWCAELLQQYQRAPFFGKHALEDRVCPAEPTHATDS